MSVLTEASIRPTWREFGDSSIDLAIDDASHQYLETAASFNVVFPRLRQHGIFVVEDWQWSTRPWHYESDYFRGKLGLSNLILQCMLVCAQRPDIIESVFVFPDMAIVTRGGAQDLKSFDIGKLATNRGTPVPLLL
jgi:hypothetical protein